MKLKRVSHDEVDREEFLVGTRAVTRPVRASIGYGGSTTIVQKVFNPLITKDGKTIANEVQLSNPAQRLGADVAKLVSAQTDLVAHDSTSTSLSIYDTLIHRGFDVLRYDTVNPNVLGRGMQKAAQAIIKQLRDWSRPIKTNDELYQIAYTASNSDKVIADQVMKAFVDVGEGNPVIMEEGRFEKEIQVQIEEGLQFNLGYWHPMFMTNPAKGTAEFKDALVLILADPIAAGQDMVDLLNQIAGYSKKPLLIIAKAIEGAAFSALLYARHPQVPNAMAYPVVPVKMPMWGQDQKFAIEDIALITGATPIGSEFGLNLVNFLPDTHLGTAKNVVVYNDRTVISGGGGDKDEIAKKLDWLRGEAKRKDKASRPYEERIQKLSGKVAVIIPGAPTEIDAKEIRYRIEDALGSVRGAKEHGYLPGGGTALWRATKALKIDELGLTEQEAAGAELVLQAALTPSKDNILNVGRKTVDEIYGKLAESKFEFGYNGETNQVEDLCKVGVIDSVLGVVTALESAVSVATRVLTSKDLIIEEDEPEKGTADRPFVD